MKRTRKETVEVCGRCNGSGKILRTETFFLNTEEEQGKFFTPVKGAPKDAEHCSVSCGATIGEAIREGIQLATALGKQVAFEFNDRLVVLSRWSDPDKEYRDWWFGVYGETPEESWAKR